jgi:membrane-associated protease RseP (regulator of RpoE activity)
MVSDFEQVFAPVKELDSTMPFDVRKVTGLPYGIGSDHDAFIEKGVPGFYLGQNGKANYNRIHHTQFDTFEGAIPEYQKHSSIVLALSAYGIANLDHKLSRAKLRAAPANPFAMRNRRMIGVQMDELKVMEVLEGSLAAKVGIKEGDEFVKLDGKKVSSREELIAEIQKGEPKKSVTIVREGKEMEFVLEWPKPASQN